MVGVTGCRHGEAAGFCVLQSFYVVTLRGHGGVEDFESLDVESVEGVCTDAGPPFVEGMGWNADAAGFFDFREHFAGGFAFEVWDCGTDAEEVPFRCAHLHARYDEETLRQLASLQIIVGLAGVVVGYGDSAQSTTSGRFDHFLGAIAGITGKKCVRVEIESVEHGCVRFPLWVELV